MAASAIRANRPKMLNEQRHDHHAGLDENHDEQEGIAPQPHTLHNQVEVLVHVQHKIDAPLHYFHKIYWSFPLAEAALYQNPAGAQEPSEAILIKRGCLVMQKRRIGLYFDEASGLNGRSSQLAL
jgi:hypothetical protein